MFRQFSPTDDVGRVLDEVDRILAESTNRARLFPRRHGFRPPIDVYDTGAEFVVKAAIPGGSAEYIDIRIEQGTVTLQGRYGYVLDHDEAKRVTWYQREILPGEFGESITLPMPIEVDQAVATFANGILTLTVPKAVAVRGKQIHVQGQPAFAK